MADGIGGREGLIADLHTISENVAGLPFRLLNLEVGGVAVTSYANLLDAIAGHDNDPDVFTGATERLNGRILSQKAALEELLRGTSSEIGETVLLYMSSIRDHTERMAELGSRAQMASDELLRALEAARKAAHDAKGYVDALHAEALQVVPEQIVLQACIDDYIRTL